MLIESDGLNIDLDFMPNFEQILTDEQWVGDASGLVPHCLAVLKTCRTLTEKLTTLAMASLHTGGRGFTQIVEVSKIINFLLIIV